MNLDLALKKTIQILSEEQARPTLRYSDLTGDWLKDAQTLIVQLQTGGTRGTTTAQNAFNKTPGSKLNLVGLRAQHPRTVLENPKVYRLESVNFDLLIRLFGQLSDTVRGELVEELAKFLAPSNKNISRPNASAYPEIQGRYSFLPLLAEFFIRTGYTDELLSAVSKHTVPTYSLAFILLQVEDMISLNFNLFSEVQLASLASILAPLRIMANDQAYSASGPRGGSMVKNPHYKPGREVESKQIVRSIDSLLSECQQALYFYLKGALQDVPNLEIEDDRMKVESFLINLGFSNEMVGALRAAETSYLTATTRFELKNCLSHLRSFLEHLHRTTAFKIALIRNDAVDDRWGSATAYLQKVGLLSKQHEAFATSLYTLISDESVHPLGTAKEYARLLRNVVIEYGVMFLSTLERRGVMLEVSS